MPFYKTEIDDVVIFEPRVFPDERGYFYESYNENTFRENGINTRFVQDNQSRSTYGVLRGLHYQLPPHAQAKLVRVLSGSILDVAVDIRRKSPTFKKWVAVELSAENAKQIFIPRGFAHGFLVLSETAEVFYKCDNLYNAASNRGIAYNDRSLAIDWRIDHGRVILSPKDSENPAFANADMCF